MDQVRLLVRGALPRIAPFVLAMAFAVVLASCSDGTDHGTSSGAPHLAVAQGNGQIVAPGAIVPTSPEVELTDGSGRPISGATIAWQAGDTAGTLDGTTSTTDQQGIAIAPAWHAPFEAGAFSLTASAQVGSQATTASVTATVSTTPSVLTRQTVGPAGGTITVNAPGSPVSGLTVSVPAGGLSTSTSFQIAEYPAPALTDVLRAASPLIQIDAGGITANAPVNITIPATATHHGQLVVVAVTANGTLMPLSLLASSPSSVTVALRFLGTPAALSRTRITMKRAPTSALNAGALQVVVAELDLPTNGSVSIGFAPTADNVAFVNYGSAWGSAQSGYCTGSSILTAWSFIQRSRGFAQGSTRSRFLPLLTPADADVSPTGDPDYLGENGWYLYDQMNPAIRLATSLQNSWGTTTALGIDPNESNATSWENVVMQLSVSRIPVVITLFRSSGGTGHAVLAYAVDFTSQRIAVIDPNAPDAADRYIQYHSVTGTFDPFTSAECATCAGETYDLINEANNFLVDEAQSIGQVYQEYLTDGLRAEYPPVSGTLLASSGAVTGITGDTTRLTVAASDDQAFVELPAFFGRADVSIMTVDASQGRTWSIFSGSVGGSTWLPIPIGPGENRIGMVLHANGLALPDDWTDAKVLIVTRPAVQASLQVDRTTVAMNGAEGSSIAPQNVTVTASGGAPVSGLSSGIAYITGSPGWLSVALTSSTTPASVTLSVPQAAGMLPGSYSAKVTITSPAGPEVQFEVDLTIAAPVTIRLSGTTASFTAGYGAANPPPQSGITVTGDGGPLTGLTAQATNYSAGASDWLTPTLTSSSAPATLTLSATTGAVPVGTYTADVAVSSPLAGNSPQLVHVTLAIQNSGCIALPYTVGTTATGSLTPTSCVGYPTGAYRQTYGTRLSSPQALDMSASGITNIALDVSLEPTIAQWSGFYSTSGTSISFKAFVAADTNQFDVTTGVPGRTGSYTMSTTPTSDGVDNCEDVVLASQVQVNESLASTDCSDGTAYADRYLIGIPPGWTATVTMRSTAFDAFLALKNADLSATVASDDDGGGGTDSRLVFQNTTSAVQNFFLYATSYVGGVSGDYTLSYTLMPPAGLRGTQRPEVPLSPVLVPAGSKRATPPAPRPPKRP